MVLFADCQEISCPYQWFAKPWGGRAVSARRRAPETYQQVRRWSCNPHNAVAVLYGSCLVLLQLDNRGGIKQMLGGAEHIGDLADSQPVFLLEKIETDPAGE